MDSHTDGPTRTDVRVPSMLDLVRLSPRPLFPPGGKDLYRQIAILTDMDPGDEVLVVACGTGVTLEYFVREHGVQGSGVEPDRALAQIAEGRVRGSDLQGILQVQHGAVNDLPYRDGIFDVVVGELGFAGLAEPREAIRELVRVAKPGAHIALVQLVWKAPVEPERQEALTAHLGVRPLMLVELKRMLREAGVEHLHVEAWTDEETAFRPALKKPFPDFAELFSLSEKLGILKRAWGRWGWRGLRTAVTRELAVHRLLTRERILGLDLITGRTRWEDSRPPDGRGENELPDWVPGGAATGRRGPRSEEAHGTEEVTRGLPLFVSRGGP